jgi:hypothetical protein
MLKMISEKEQRKNLTDAVADLQAQISVEKDRKMRRELETAWILQGGPYPD